MIGSRATPMMSTKAAETKWLFYFVMDLLPEHVNKLLPINKPEELLAAGRALHRYSKILEAQPRKISPARMLESICFPSTICLDIWRNKYDEKVIHAFTIATGMNPSTETLQRSLQRLTGRGLNELRFGSLATFLRKDSRLPPGARMRKEGWENEEAIQETQKQSFSSGSSVGIETRDGIRYWARGRRTDFLLDGPARARR
eukprot:8748398-Pyramimonas_sp.AAC.1